VADWYYIGHYGQLGPLTRDQIDELIAGEVITRETYVWRTGMSDWASAEAIPELRDGFAAKPFAAQPPPPFSKPSAEPSMPATPYGTESWTPSYASPYSRLESMSMIRSDRSRVVAGILQLVLPGVGRIYLGYAAIGVLQILITLITCLFGWIWAFIDGILILAGTPKLDGYGRVLSQ